MSKLRISDDLALPLDAVTQTIGILAKRRAGKSYLARRLAEQIHGAGAQVVIVDPKGDWWGIRSAADGKAPGLPIVIIGGERGDVKLEPGGGEVVAKLVVEERVSALLDLSLLRKHEAATFMADFLESLYRLKAHEKNRTTVMLIIDEADAVAPQNVKSYGVKGGNVERMLGAAEDIVRRGGQRGIGCTLVTQRSAVLNKNVLTQVQILIALRTIAPQDLKAMDEWINVHGTPEQRKTLMESLPSLPVGDAWVWSPGWPTDAGIFTRIHAAPISTFDSGNTPKHQERRVEPKAVAEIDLEAVSRQMAATIERAKADDPRELRKRIADLERALKTSAQPNPKAAPERQLKVIEKPVLQDAQIKRLEAIVEKLSRTHAAAIDATKARWEAVVEAQQAALDTGKEIVAALVAASTGGPKQERAHAGGGGSAAVALTARTSRPAPVVSAPPTGELDAGQQRILDTVLMLNLRGITPTRETVARWMGIHPNGGRYNSQLADLRARHYLVGMELTSQSASLARDQRTGPEALLAALPDAGHRKVMEAILGAGGPLSREDLAGLLGIHPNGGRFNSQLGWLRTMGVIPERGSIVATEGAHR